MRLTPWIVAGGLTFALCALPLFGQPADKPAPTSEGPKAVKLPLTRVVLFNAGFGYFERTGTIDGPSKLALKVNEEDINDLILTLMVNDPSGTARAVTYDNRAPAEITLKAFAIDLTENPSIGNLLHQVRGEKVEITEVSGSTIAGSIVSVTKPEPRVKTSGLPGEESKTTVVPAPEGSEQVGVFTEDGLQTVALAKIKKVKFTKPELQAEFKKALEALANARGAATKSVGVSFPGAGVRKVSVGYVTEAPLWKPTYRLTVGDGAPKIVGLAAVENTTDEDWENVKIKLVSGRPMAFTMDLYDPLFVPRPQVEQELYASLKPPVYQGPAQGMMGGGFGNLGNGVAQGGGQGGFGGGQGGFGGGRNLGVGGGALGNSGGNLGGQFGVQGGAFGQYSNVLARPSVRSLLGNRLDHESYRARVAAPLAPVAPSSLPTAAAKGMNLGESFEYQVLEPVSLPRFKSALLPIVNETIEMERISLFTKEVLSTHPLKGLRLKNTSKLFLAQGPVTVFEGDTVAGQARLADVKPGETRLLSYAIDLDVAMTATDEVRETKSLSVKIVAGEVRVATRQKATAKFTAFNKSAEARTIWITQAKKTDWKLIAPTKAAETTADLERFELKVSAGKEASLDIVEERDVTETTSLLAILDATVIRFSKMDVASPAVKAALAKVQEAMPAPRLNEIAIAEEEAALKTINEAQARMRSNLAVADKASDIYKRYLKKFDDQETEIENRQTKIVELNKLKLKLAKEFKEMVAGLNAE